ncbi:hypothetical protein [Naasia aerilata]|uniref:Uncharacterized protein n=1 Tax=Naasia aerilata TaxID=1162966 RepID=A0ABN6XLR1_9MICO|nr:hypothetical protein [Naasia aerilata]BDZ45819.1 hypothetical protein GCM10025866_17280 [Naasia aerilata]
MTTRAWKFARRESDAGPATEQVRTGAGAAGAAGTARGMGVGVGVGMAEGLGAVFAARTAVGSDAPGPATAAPPATAPPSAVR